MATCKWCGEENADGVNVCSFCGQDMSIFEDSGIMKNINAAEQSKARIPVAAVATGATTGSMNTGAVRSAARAQQIQQAQKKTEYVTRNQLKQVAYRLDRKSRVLTALAVVIAIAALAGIAIAVLAFLRSQTPVDNSAIDSKIEQLQSQVSTLELELQSVKAQMEDIQTNENAVIPDTTGETSETGNETGVNITTTGDPEPSQPDEPTEPAEPSTNTTGGSSLDEETEIDTTFEAIAGDATSINAVVNQAFEGTTTYQWQKSPNLETWTDVNTSAAKTERLKISVDDYLRNNAYRCRITNVDTKGVTVVYYTEIVDYNAYQIWSLIG